MAEKTLKTRILLRYADIDAWKASPTVLKKGEVAIVTVPNEDASGASQHRPAVLMKVGDGENTFDALPWVQGIAADVYSWAKAATKPTYQANEIEGLSDYISSEIKDTNTTYRISKVSEYQYKLESKEIDGDWAEVSLIDLPDDTEAIAALNALVGETPVATQITAAIAAIANSDAAVANQFVTAVKQENGIVTIERAALTEADIPTLSISKVTGLQNALNAKQDTLVFESPYDAETNKVATKADITAAVGSLAGAMHFEGVKDQVPENNSGYESGDVILVGNKEYVFDGSVWHELGDETIYAVKGNIVNADIAAGAAIDQSKIANLTTDLAAKLDSTIAESTYVKQNGTDRLMTAEEGTKLQGIAEGAQVNVIEEIQVNGEKVEPSGKVVNVAIPQGALASKDQVAEGDLESSLASKINGKVDDSALAAIAKTGSVNDLVQSPEDVLILDCGGAE